MEKAATESVACLKCGHRKNDPNRRGADRFNSFCVRGCGCDCEFPAPTSLSDAREAARQVLTEWADSVRAGGSSSDDGLIDRIAALVAAEREKTAKENANG